MPFESTFPRIALPETDVFSFFFRRTDRKWSDKLGTIIFTHVRGLCLTF